MIFFDLDGTLIDHDYAAKKAVMEMLKERNIQGNQSEDEIYKIWIETLEKYFDLYLQGKLTHSEQRVERIRSFYKLFNVNLDDEDIEKTFKTYLVAYQNNWKLYDDVIDCLKALTKYRLGIISNGYLDQQIAKLKRTGINELFDVIVTSNEIGVAKPEKEIFIHACERAQVDISECIYIGDRFETDAIGSTEAGMKAIWLDRTGDYQRLRGNIEVINSLKELDIK